MKDAVTRWFLGIALLMPLPLTAQELEVLYVGNNRAGTISVIGVPEYDVLGEFDAVPDLDNPARGSAAFADDVIATPEGRILYVSRPQNRDIAAFDTATEKLLWKIPTEGKPDHFTMSPDGRHLFVSINSERYAAVVDTETRSIVKRFPTGPLPHGMRMSPDGRFVFNGAMGSDRITVADATSFEVVRNIELDEGVRPFTITQDGKKLYAQLTRFHGFVEVDLETGRHRVRARRAVPMHRRHGSALCRHRELSDPRSGRDHTSRGRAELGGHQSRRQTLLRQLAHRRHRVGHFGRGSDRDKEDRRRRLPAENVDGANSRTPSPVFPVISLSVPSKAQTGAVARYFGGLRWLVACSNA